MFSLHKMWLAYLLIALIPGVAALTARDAQAYTHHKSPIHWIDYSGQAFARAKAENKPIFMLITAVWCYNCQIYEEKTLKKPSVAEFINKHYIPVFVDYDRRRDIAATYSAVGIPITTIFAPDGEVLVNAPGYIPKDTLLTNLQKTLDYLAKDYEPSSTEESESGAAPLVHPTKMLLDGYGEHFVSEMSRGLDPAYGGFGIGQKEPYADVLLRLLELKEQGAERWTEPLQITLDAILGLTIKLQERERLSFEKLQTLRRKQTSLLSEVEALQTKDMIAGIYDRIEGGFFRYDTRRNWTVPHFEKMLFENSQLVDMFLKAYVLYKKTAYKDAAINSLAYIQRVLFSQNDGRFYGSQLADEVYYHFTADERKQATMPPIDQTSYTVPSARAVIMFLNAAETLHHQQYRHTAIRAIDFLANKMTGKNGAFSYYDPQKKKGMLNGRLEDNAWMAAAFLRAYEATGDKKYLELTKRLAQFAAKNLYDPVSGGFFARRSTSRELYRKDELFDKTKNFANNGTMASVLLGLYEQTKDSSWLAMLEGTVGNFFRDIDEGRLKADSPEFSRIAKKMVALGKY
ncbi:MAG: hypothetical protein BMS9Abin06_0643 [Gammaproteobacteria bacterium]|nr:MAG: hypothetical protein BMS9Abin06_0643 [Gammaproteobacteria bacterium]